MYFTLPRFIGISIVFVLSLPFLSGEEAQKDIEIRQKPDPELVEEAESHISFETNAATTVEEEIEIDESEALSEPKQNAATTSRGSEKEQAPAAEYHQVLSVVDGDTLNISMNGTKDSVRLIGIDTPETVHPSEPVECFGQEASDKAKEMLTGKEVHLEFDDSQGRRDKYDRLLAYVFLKDNTHFNKLMLEEGYAYEYTYNVPYAYQDEFKATEADAREHKRGLWADGVCEDEGEEPEPSANEASFQSTDQEPTPTTPVGADCHPSYSPCLRADASDYDCAGGAGNGPYYTETVQVIGTDVFKLDSDGDGLGCE